MADNNVWTVRRVLEWTIAHLKAHGSETPRLDTEILLAHARGCQRIDLYTHYDDRLSDDERNTMRQLVQRRATAEPVAYLVGHREFFGLEFRVTRDVLIPRPDTETLVVELLDLARPRTQPRILDVGTGSGAIAVAAAVNKPDADLTAIDISAEALTIAQQNAAAHNVADRVRFLHGDLFAPLAVGEQFDIIACNPPYVAETDFDALQPDVRLHEPRHALLGGPDGLDIARRLIAHAPRYLVPGGHLLMEISPEQAPAVRQLLEAQRSFDEIKVLKDLAGDARVASARKV